MEPGPEAKGSEIKYLFKGWKEGRAVTNTRHSCRGPEFSFQHPGWAVTHSHSDSSSGESNALCWSLQRLVLIYVGVPISLTLV